MIIDKKRTRKEVVVIVDVITYQARVTSGHALVAA